MSSILKIDGLTRVDHSNLAVGDNCFYLMEYAAKQGYGHSDANSLIMNFKKPLSRKGQRDWPYKSVAINKIGTTLCGLQKEWIENWTWVPIPPSKHIEDPEYDDRVVKVLQILNNVHQITILDAFMVKESREATHNSDASRSIEDIKGNLDFNKEAFASHQDSPIMLFDDVLTTGAHFKACQQLILESFPNSRIHGFFVARRVPLPSPRIPDFELLPEFPPRPVEKGDQRDSSAFW